MERNGDESVAPDQALMSQRKQRKEPCLPAGTISLAFRHCFRLLRGLSSSALGPFQSLLTGASYRTLLGKTDRHVYSKFWAVEFESS